MVAAVERGRQGSSSEADGGEAESECPALDAREQELTQQVPQLLETMNRTSNEVNTYELLLAQTQRTFKKLLAQWSELYEALRSQHGGALDRVRPYFDAQQVHASASARVQDMVREFSAATALHTTAKQELRQLEREMESGGATVSLDSEHQEAFSKATVRVLKCQQEKDHREQEYANALREFQDAQDSMEAWRVQIGDSAIKRAMPSFRQLQSHQKKLAAEQARINALTERVRHAKAAYHNSMRELDRISTAVHEARREYREVEASQPPAAAEAAAAAQQQQPEASPSASSSASRVEAEAPEPSQLPSSSSSSTPPSRRTPAALQTAEEGSAPSSPPRQPTTLAERLICQQRSQQQQPSPVTAAQPEDAPEARTPQAAAAATTRTEGADASPPPTPSVLLADDGARELRDEREDEEEEAHVCIDSVASPSGGKTHADKQQAGCEALVAPEHKAAAGGWTHEVPPELSPESCPS